MSTMIPVADFEQQQQHLVLVIEKIKSSSNLHFHICTLLSDRLNLVVTWWWLNESWGLPTRPKLPSATASPSYFLSATSNSPPQPHECVDSPLARSPAGKSGLKLLHTSWGSAECVPIYGHLPHYSWRRVRPNLPHANLKIGPGPRKRPPASCLFIHQSKNVYVWSWIASKLGFNRPNSLGNKTAWINCLWEVGTTFPVPWISLLWVWSAHSCVHKFGWDRSWSPLLYPECTWIHVHLSVWH